MRILDKSSYLITEYNYIGYVARYAFHTLVLITTSVFEISTLDIRYMQGQGTFGKVAR